MQEAPAAVASNKNMIVAVRVRPLSQRETAAGHKQCCNLLSDKIVVISKQQQAKYLRSQKGSMNEYAFDAAFDEHSSQQQVYDATAKPFMKKLVEGFNVTVFAYGATGAGKTHTMMGNTRYDESSVNADAGIIPNALQDVFHLIGQEKEKNDIGVKWSVGVTFIEVYNEQVYDLLQPMGKCLPLREDKVKGVVEIAGVAEKTVSNPNEVLSLLQQGNKHRKTEATMANQVSSRSHAVLQLMVRRTRSTVGGREAVVESKLSLIDLAGSERASATQNRGARLNEGANINKSLLALANCINALSEKSNGKTRSVKFRDSKLTHLLRSSLEGNCSLIMIANINPSDKTFEDSHNTLKYANRAKNIKVDPTVTDHVKESNWMERETRLREENMALRNQVAELQKKMQMLHQTESQSSQEFYVMKEVSSQDGFGDDMDVVDEPLRDPVSNKTEREVRIAAPIPSKRSASTFTRRGHMLRPQIGSSAAVAPEEEPDLSINLRQEKTPRSGRKKKQSRQQTESDKSLFTLGSAYAISQATDEQHELMNTTAAGRAALLPKYSIRLGSETEPSSPVRSRNQEELVRKKHKPTDDIPKYSVCIDDPCDSPLLEDTTPLRRSARKRAADEMSSTEAKMRSQNRWETNFSERGLAGIIAMPESPMDICGAETPLGDFLDEIPLQINKKRRGSGIPMRNGAVSASTSVLPSENRKISLDSEGPETDITSDESFMLKDVADLVPLHAAKGSKPTILKAAASYYNNKFKTTNTTTPKENDENIQKGVKPKYLTSKHKVEKPGKMGSASKQTRAPLGAYLTNKIQSSQRRSSEVAPL